MELRQLKYFLTIADSPSLTAAARTLMVTQPTLTMSMKKLESDLGTKLFHTSQKGAPLTEVGQMLYDQGGPLLASFNSLETRIKQWDSQQRLKIRIGLTTLFSMQHMQRLAHYMATHSSVELSLVQGGSREMQRRLAEGEVDLGILSFPQHDPGIVLDQIPGELGSYDVACVLPVDHPLGQKPSVTFMDLSGESWSTLGPSFVLSHLLTTRATACGFTPKVVFTNDDWEVLVSSVIELRTVCLLPTGLEKFSRHDDVVWVRLDDRANQFKVGLGTRKGAVIHPALHELIEVLRAPT